MNQIITDNPYLTYHGQHLTLIRSMSFPELNKKVSIAAFKTYYDSALIDGLLHIYKNKELGNYFSGDLVNNSSWPIFIYVNRLRDFEETDEY